MAGSKKAKKFLILFYLLTELNKQTLSRWKRISFKILLPEEMPLLYLWEISVYRNVPQKLIPHFNYPVHHNQAITVQNQN